MEEKTNKTEINKSETNKIETFEDIGLSEKLLHGIYSCGFEKPSLIQKKSIPIIKSGKDLIAQSQSGTGKTGSFSIGTLSKVNPDENNLQGIILSPTRDLSKQIYGVIKSVGSYLNLNIEEIVGGSGTGKLKNKVNAHIIVGTPGKVLDEMERGNIVTKKLKIFVLDEADEMLSSGFQEQLKSIFNFIPKSTQVCLFSATIPKEVLNLSERILFNPEKLLIDKEKLTLEGIRQYCVYLDRDQDKLFTLIDLFEKISVTQCIMYCNNKKRLMDLVHKLNKQNFSVTYIHGNMHQNERNNIINKFKLGEFRFLISTDVLARGIDIQQVSLVINYDITENPETYLHRIGRSGRFGRKGMAINLVTKYDSNNLKRIEDHFKINIEELPNNFGDYL